MKLQNATEQLSGDAADARGGSTWSLFWPVRKHRSNDESLIPVVLDGGPALRTGAEPTMIRHRCPGGVLGNVWKLISRRVGFTSSHVHPAPAPKILIEVRRETIYDSEPAAV